MEPITLWIQYPECTGPCLAEWKGHLKVVDRKLDTKPLVNGRRELPKTMEKRPPSLYVAQFMHAQAL